MGKYSISTGTVTYALRGRDVLRYNGIKAFVERSTAPDAIGCGYSITATGDINKITELLKNRGIKILDVKEII